MIQAGAGQAFGEPIDAANGAFLMSASDFILPDITDSIELARSYRSTDRRCGWMGKGWHFSHESRLCRDGETVHAQLPYGYRVAFARTGEAGQPEVFLME